MSGLLLIVTGQALQMSPKGETCPGMVSSKLVG